MGSTVDFKIIILSVFLILLAIKLFLSQVSKHPDLAKTEFFKQQRTHLKSPHHSQKPAIEFKCLTLPSS